MPHSTTVISNEVIYGLVVIVVLLAFEGGVWGALTRGGRWLNAQVDACDRAGPARRGRLSGTAHSSAAPGQSARIWRISCETDDLVDGRAGGRRAVGGVLGRQDLDQPELSGQRVQRASRPAHGPATGTPLKFGAAIPLSGSAAISGRGLQSALAGEREVHQRARRRRRAPDRVDYRGQRLPVRARRARPPCTRSSTTACWPCSTSARPASPRPTATWCSRRCPT